MVVLHRNIMYNRLLFFLLSIFEKIFSVVHFRSLEDWNFVLISLIFGMISTNYLFDISVPMMHISLSSPILIMFEIEIPPSKVLHIDISNPENSCRFLKYFNLTDSLMWFDIARRPSLKTPSNWQLFWDGLWFVI